MGQEPGHGRVVIRANIHTEFLFDQVDERVERLALESVEAAAVEAQRVAVAAGAARGLTEIEVIEARATGAGYASGIRGKWFYFFHSYGTLGRAIKPKRPGRKRSHAPGTGITPNRMFQQARLAGRRAMLERARRGI